MTEWGDAEFEKWGEGVSVSVRRAMQNSRNGGGNDFSYSLHQLARRGAKRMGNRECVELAKAFVHLPNLSY
ncbi:hypothetical protein KIPB_010589, partial [Kipferlia bialata]|eukprot:g10589.t1